MFGETVCLDTISNFGNYGMEGSIRVGIDKESHGHLQVISLCGFTTKSIRIAQLTTSMPGGNISSFSLF